MKKHKRNLPSTFRNIREPENPITKEGFEDILRNVSRRKPSPSAPGRAKK